MEVSFLFQHPFAIFRRDLVLRGFLVGLALLVPVYGWIVLCRWTAGAFQEPMVAGGVAAPRDERTRGWTLVAATLLALLAVAIPLGLAALALSATHHRVTGFLPPEILQPVVTTLALVVTPELVRRALADADPWTVLRPGPSLRRIARAPMAYAVTVLVGLLVLLFVAMASTCCVGAILGVPLGAAMLGRLAFAWERASASAIAA